MNAVITNRPIGPARTARLWLTLWLLAGIAIAGFASPAGAHQPVFVDATDATPLSSPVLLDGTVSFAIYGSIAKSGERRFVRARLRKGELLVVELLIPYQEPERSASEATLPTVQVRAPGGKTFAVPTTKRRVFFEPFSHTTYAYVASFSGEARDGVYELGVTGHGKARFTLVLGNRETGGVVEGESPQASDALANWWSGSVKSTGSGGGK